MPYENRKGFINRALYCRLVPKSKRDDRDGLKEKEIDKLIKHVKKGNDLFATKASGRYERMSSGKYYEVCSYVATLAKPAFRLLFLYSFFVDLLKLNESSRSQS